jgi:hypothetical protein
MMPTTIDCPFNEVIFDPEQKVLAVVSKDSKEKPMMMPRLNDRGDLVQAKRANGEQGWQEQRVIMNSYYEYYIEDINDIVAFVKMFAVNDTAQVFSNTLQEAFELGITEEGKKAVAAKKK